MKYISLLLSCIVFAYVFYLLNNQGSEPDTRIEKEELKPTVTEIKQHHSPQVSVETPPAPSKPKTLQILHDENGQTVITSESEVVPNNELKKLYKWRDSDNIIIISSIPPEDVSIAEIFYYYQPVEAVTSAEESKRQQTGSSERKFIHSPISVYTPSGLKELIEYSQELGEKIELRGEELDGLIKQL